MYLSKSLSHWCLFKKTPKCTQFFMCFMYCTMYFIYCTMYSRDSRFYIKFCTGKKLDACIGNFKTNLLLLIFQTICLEFKFLKSTKVGDHIHIHIHKHIQYTYVYCTYSVANTQFVYKYIGHDGHKTISYFILIIKKQYLSFQ